MAVSQQRVSVLLGTYERQYKLGNKTETIKNQMYTWVRKEVAEYFNLTVVKNPKGGKNNKGAEVRGTKGAGSIKLPTGKKTAKGYPQYYAIPVPSFFKVQDMREFINKLKHQTLLSLLADAVIQSTNYLLHKLCSRMVVFR